MLTAEGITLDWESDAGDPKGTFDLKTEIVSIDYALAENRVGVMQIRFMPCEKAEDIQEWDRFCLNFSDGCGGDPVLEGETAWYTLKIRNTRNVSGVFVTVWAYTANVLAECRSIPAYAELPQAKKTGAGDDLIKEIWLENFGAGAVGASNGAMIGVPARDWSAHVGVEANASAAPVVSKAMSWRKQVFAVMVEIAEDSTRLGTPLFFDIIKNGRRMLFITRTVSRGENRLFGQSVEPLVLSVDNGRLTESSYTRDHRDEFTFAYAAGRGEETARQHSEADDPDRIALTVFGRRETVRDARNTHDPSVLVDEARSAVVAGRPERILDVVLSPDFLAEYNKTWAWGDLVTMTHGNTTVAAAISKVSVTIQENVVSVEPTIVERYGFTL